MVKAFGKECTWFNQDRVYFKPKGLEGHIEYSLVYLEGDEEDFNFDELRSVPFFIKDALSFTRKFTYIELVKVDGEENKGTGSKLLQAFLKEHKEELIILNAGATDEETYENYLDEHLKKLTHFYEKNGFKNINDKIGFYEDTIVFGYDNKVLRDTFFKE